MSNKIKHLEFIQAAVARFSDHSFKLKGWAIVLLAALSAISARESNGHFVLLAFIPTLILWGLDGYYLSIERQYRALFNVVRVLAEEKIEFSMQISESQRLENSWASATISKTLCLFYGSLIASIGLLFMVVN